MTKDPASFPQTSLLGWTRDYPDPQNWLSIDWTCGSIIHVGRGDYCNEEFDAVIHQASAAAAEKGSTAEPNGYATPEQMNGGAP